MEQLLKILEDNARLPIEDIATMLNKSPAEVAAMIDLARAQGIIKGYKTLVDWEKAGVNRVEAVIEMCIRDSTTTCRSMRSFRAPTWEMMPTSRSPSVSPASTRTVSYTHLLTCIHGKKMIRYSYISVG